MLEMGACETGGEEGRDGSGGRISQRREERGGAGEAMGGGLRGCGEAVGHIRRRLPLPPPSPRARPRRGCTSSRRATVRARAAVAVVVPHGSRGGTALPTAGPGVPAQARRLAGVTGGPSGARSEEESGERAALGGAGRRERRGRGAGASRRLGYAVPQSAAAANRSPFDHYSPFNHY